MLVPSQGRLALRPSCQAGEVPSTNFDICGCAVEAGAGTELTVGALTELPSTGVVLSPDPDCGCAAEAGAGTELRTVGTLNRAAEPGGGAVTGP